MILPVTEENLISAAEVHAASWQDSHKSFCSPSFVAEHTVQRQSAYLRGELAQGKRLWLLLDPEPVGLVSVWRDVIENLYVLPEKQERGYGTQLLRFAMSQCRRPSLWVLNNNRRAYDLYSREGFIPSGVENRLSDTLFELEMVYMEESHES